MGIFVKYIHFFCLKNKANTNLKSNDKNTKKLKNEKNKNLVFIDFTKKTNLHLIYQKRYKTFKNKGKTIKKCEKIF